MSPVRRLEVTWDKSACPTPHTHTHAHTNADVCSGLYINSCPTAQDSLGSVSLKEDAENNIFVLRGSYTLHTLPCLRDLQLH